MAYGMAVSILVGSVRVLKVGFKGHHLFCAYVLFCICLDFTTPTVSPAWISQHLGISLRVYDSLCMILFQHRSFRAPVNMEQRCGLLALRFGARSCSRWLRELSDGWSLAELDSHCGRTRPPRNTTNSDPEHDPE